MLHEERAKKSYLLVEELFFHISVLLWTELCPSLFYTHPNLYVETITPNVPVFGERASKEIIKQLRLRVGS